VTDAIEVVCPGCGTACVMTPLRSGAYRLSDLDGRKHRDRCKSIEYRQVADGWGGHPQFVAGRVA
jgi:hypothetical protein